MSKPDATKRQAILLTALALASCAVSAKFAHSAIWGASVFDGWLIGAMLATGISTAICSCVAVFHWYELIDELRRN